MTDIMMFKFGFVIGMIFIGTFSFVLWKVLE